MQIDREWGTLAVYFWNIHHLKKFLTIEILGRHHLLLTSINSAWNINNSITFLLISYQFLSFWWNFKGKVDNFVIILFVHLFQVSSHRAPMYFKITFLPTSTFIWWYRDSNLIVSHLSHRFFGHCTFRQGLFGYRHLSQTNFGHFFHFFAWQWLKKRKK